MISMTSIIISTNVLKTTINRKDIYRKSWASKQSIDKLIYNTFNLNRWRPGCPEWKVGYDDDVDDYFDDHIPWWHDHGDSNQHNDNFLDNDHDGDDDHNYDQLTVQIFQNDCSEWRQNDGILLDAVFF